MLLMVKSPVATDAVATSVPKSVPTVKGRLPLLVSVRYWATCRPLPTAAVMLWGLNVRASGSSSAWFVTVLP